MTDRHESDDDLASLWERAVSGVDASLVRVFQQGNGAVRRKHVDDMWSGPGEFGARVHDYAAPAEKAAIRWTLPTEHRWRAVIAELGGQVRHVAAVIERELTPGLIAAFEHAGVSLVPDVDDLVPSCSCGATTWCVHAAAVVAAMIVRLRRAPFEVVALRGKPYDVLLRQVEESRGDSSGDLVVTFDVTQDLYRMRGDIEAIRIHPQPPRDATAFLRRLGAPDDVDDPELLYELVEEAATFAWRLAAGDGADIADDELLLAELRGQGTSTASVIADALGMTPDDVEQRLDELYGRGAVMRTGSGDRSRYRAVADRSGRGTATGE